VERREARALGSPLRLLVAGRAEPARVEAAWAAVQQEFDGVDRAMSRFREDSEITLLHRRGERGERSEPLSSRLRAALALADRAHRQTRGRFDARVIADLERLGSPGVRQSWAGAKRDSSRPYLFDPGQGTAELRSPVDLGGVGKGLALRWAARRAAAALGKQGLLLEAGGDIAARARADGRPWAIAIEDPLGGAEPIATCALHGGGAIATSSVRLSTWRDARGRVVHHLIDPQMRGPGGGGLIAVTVAGPDPAWAEIWSKALFVEGPAQIGAVARSRGLAAWWVDADGSLSMTPRARQLTTWVRAEGRATERRPFSPPAGSGRCLPPSPRPATD
jgi:FAD:protein FMN transferase